MITIHQQESKKLTADVEAFLAANGKVEQIKNKTALEVMIAGANSAKLRSKAETNARIKRLTKKYATT